MPKSITLISLSLLAILMPNAKAAPPLQYSLKQVSISLTQNAPNPYQIRITGDGNGSFQHNSTAKIANQISITEERMLELINNFYQIRFFDMQNDYAVTKWVELKEHATLATVSSKINDASTKQLCIRLGSYSKCLDIVAEQPSSANVLANRIYILFMAAALLN